MKDKKDWGPADELADMQMKAGLVSGVIVAIILVIFVVGKMLQWISS